jgi:hypothetical protein
LPLYIIVCSQRHLWLKVKNSEESNENNSLISGSSTSMSYINFPSSAFQTISDDLSGQRPRVVTIRYLLSELNSESQGA